MRILNDLKEIADLVKKMGNFELHRRILQLEEEIIAVTRRNRELEEQLAQQAAMEFRKPFYVKTGDPHPLCPKCWEGDGKQVHLTGPEGHVDYYSCPVCPWEYCASPEREGPPRRRARPC